MELLRRDDINIDYILSLLRDLDSEDEGYEAAKEFIYKTLAKDPSLKSKKKLIEEFINSVLNTSGDVEGDFETFLLKEKSKEIGILVQQENLDRVKVEQFLEEYEFSGRYDEELLAESFMDIFTFLDGREKKQTLLDRLQELIAKYSY